MDCCNIKKINIQKQRTDKIILLIEDLSKTQKEIMEYIQKLEKSLETKKK